jgi:hypothetical protein
VTHAIQMVGATATAGNDLGLILNLPCEWSHESSAQAVALERIESGWPHIGTVSNDTSGTGAVSDAGFRYQHDLALLLWLDQATASNGRERQQMDPSRSRISYILVLSTEVPSFHLLFVRAWAQDSIGAAVTYKMKQIAVTTEAKAPQMLPAFADTRPISEAEARELLGYLQDPEFKPSRPIRRVREVDAPPR